MFNIYDYVQVNSNFFFSEKFCDNFSNKKYSFKIPLKILNKDNIQGLFEDVAFGDKSSALYLKTNKGCFFLFSISDIEDNNIVVEMLKNNSKEASTYYFSNVDYFSYGKFGVAENGKITRYLAVNTEANEEKDIVAWIGKPHKFEYETHTFFTKQKLMDCEMFFDSDVVCDMVTYYLPFVCDDVKIIEAKVFSDDKDIGKLIKNILSDKKTYEKINKEKLNNSLNHLIKNQAPYFSTHFIVNKNGFVTIINKLITVYGEFSPTTKVLSSLKQETINIIKMTKVKFYNLVLSYIYDYENAKIVELGEISRSLPKNIYNKNHYMMQILGTFKNKTLKPFISYDTGRYYDKQTDEYINKNRKFVKCGRHLNKRHINAFYDAIIKNISLL